MARRNNKHYEDILEQGVDLIKFYLENPTTAAYELLGVDFAPIQRVVFNDMWFKDYVIAVCSRGYGKTLSIGVLSALSAMLKPGYRVGLISSSFRQCLATSDDFATFWTNKGLISGVNSLYQSNEVDHTQSSMESNKISNKWLNPKQKCLRIVTTKGFEISGALDHKVLVLCDDLELDYKNIEDLDNETPVVIRKGFNYYGNIDNIDFNNDLPIISKYKGDITLPSKLSPDLSYIIGLLCGDGYLSSDGLSNQTWTIGYCSSDYELIESYKSKIKSLFNITPRERLSGKTYIAEINSIVLHKYLSYIGISNRGAKYKSFPNAIKKSSRKNIVAFIQGLMDTDGGCNFYNKEGYKSSEVAFVSSSKLMCKELQAALLNVGVFSSFSVASEEKTVLFNTDNKNHKCSKTYRIRINGATNISNFSKLVGFRLSRKTDILNTYLSSISKSFIDNIIPYSFVPTYNLAMECLRNNGDKNFLKYYTNKYKKYRRTDYTRHSIKKLIDYSKSLGLHNNSYYTKLKNIIELNIDFVYLKDSNYFEDYTVDIEVDKEHCYWSSGFISHNSKMIFAEIEKLYAQSSIFREACDKPPIRGTDSCYVKFKSVGGSAPSYIEAVPLGNDGGKIRGSRFYLIVVDELAQVPSQTLDMVIKPMAATSLAPMERVRRLEQQNKLISLGLATEEDFEKEAVNKMIMTSSGFYKFNHMWTRMQDYWNQINKAEAEGSDVRYAVWQVPYWDLPPGFLDSNNIESAKRTMSAHEFSMEYEAAMVSDSEGFFKASIIENCTINSGHNMEVVGDKQSQYVVGVDPNQGGKASTGVVIIKIGTVNRIVNVLELKGKTTQELAGAIQEICDNYNVARIFMDRFGGGKAICDLLEEGYGGVEPIIDRNNIEHISHKGRHILDMIQFNPAWIADANFTTKAMLESKDLLFPEYDIASLSDTDSIKYESVAILKSQMLSIIVTQTSTGLLHFDTPSKNQNKDLYSALILAAHGAKMLSKESEEEVGVILHNNSGLIRLHDGSSNFRTFSHIGGNTQKPYAILKKKK